MKEYERNCQNELFELQESTRNDRLAMIEKEAGSWLYGACLDSFGEIENLMSSPVDALVIDNIYLSDDYTLRCLELYKSVLSGELTTQQAFDLLRAFDLNINYSSLSEIKKTVLDKEKK